jgi:hypothetical protein
LGGWASDSPYEIYIAPVIETKRRPVPWRFHVELQIATNRDSLELRMSSKSNVSILANVWKAGDICNLHARFDKELEETIIVMP